MLKSISKVKNRIIRTYLSFLPLFEIDIDSLIYPHREDINLRIEFLRNKSKSNNHYKNSLYIEFLKHLNRHPYYINEININDQIEKFIILYNSIKKEGYQPKIYGPITVEKRSSKMRFVYPHNGRILNGLNVKNDYNLVEGAHRVAILKLLGFKKIQVKQVYRNREFSSDYTSFIEQCLKTSNKALK